jgi:hypothetical protein
LDQREGGNARQSEQGGKSVDLRDKTRDAADKAEAAANTQIDQAAARVSNVSNALSETARNIEGQEEWAARSLHFASDQLSGLARSIEGKSLNELFAQSKTLARENPALFYGACAALGFVAARFASASEEGNSTSKTFNGGRHGN